MKRYRVYGYYETLAESKNDAIEKPEVYFEIINIKEISVKEAS